MPALILRRLVAALLVLVGVSIVVFVVIHIVPGGTAEAMLGTFATPEAVARLNADLGLDRSLPEQYAIWISNAATGNLGQSYVLRRPVEAELADRLPPTLLLAGTAFAVSSVLGLLLGTYSALRQNGWQDRLVTVVSLVGISTPPFFLGMLLIGGFARPNGSLPPSGMTELFGGGGWADVGWHLLLPALTLSAVATAVLVRLTRTAVLEVLRQDHVRAARAKGLPERRVILRHVFRNALVTVLPVLGVEAGFVFGGAVYIEVIFQWPGLGRMLVNAISTRDILLVQGGVLVVAAAYVLINLVVDIAQYLLDRRVRVA